jgi:hypothetical protein
MAYLDVSPMISSLRRAPDEFEVIRGALHHFPSRHKFRFDPEGRVTVDALCDCAMLAVRHEQEQELHDAFQQWQAAYWRPLEINKEFASHFRRPNALQRVYRKLMGRLRRALIQDGVPDLANAARSEVRVRP